MLTLNDGRSELWQWDTGRKLTVDADCTQVHFSNKFFGRSVDVDVFDGTAEIPDVLLQVDKDLLVWAFVGTAENGYTKISKVFKVNKRNKPADYVFTPTEQTTLGELIERLARIEESQDPDAIKNAVDDYLANNPIEIEEKDPTVPDWAKKETKPSYSKSEVGLGNVDNVKQYSASNPPPYPVASVNGQTGKVQLGAADVGARPSNWMPTAQEVGALPDTYVPPNQTAAQVGADPAGTAAAAVSAHNTSTDSHGDLRLELKAINDRLTAFFDSDNQTLDELSEIVTYITSNKSLIDSITTSKVSVTDIINNLTSNVANKPLSAAQGVALKGLIDAVSTSLSNYQPKGDYALASAIPTKVSQLQNDKGYLTEHQDISGKLDADKLPEAVNAALAQAKDSGEFDGDPGAPGVTPHIGSNGNWYIGSADTGVKAQGKDGTSVTVKSVSESTADGGSNVVTFSNGKTLTVKNGKQGSAGKTPVRGVDYYTEADKAEIVAMVIESLGGNPVFGYVDENNNIIVSGNLPDGTYAVKYEMENGSTVNIGNLVLDTNVYYSVTNTLTQCTTNNSATQAVQGGSYSATITAKSGYELKSIVVKMGGTDVSSTAVSGGKITIANVTGNIVITAVAEEIKANYTNLADPTSADWLENTRISSSGFPTQSGITTSNWIAVTKGDVVRIKGIDVNTHQYARVAFFGATKNLLSSAKVSGLVSTDATGITYDTTGAQLTIASTNAKFIRICGELKGAASDVIITKNEPIE